MEQPWDASVDALCGSMWEFAYEIITRCALVLLSLMCFLHRYCAKVLALYSGLGIAFVYFAGPARVEGPFCHMFRLLVDFQPLVLCSIEPHTTRKSATAERETPNGEL